MHDAIREIKDTLGPTRSFRRRSGFGHGQRLRSPCGTMLEVVAASDEEALAADLSMAGG
ncbi:MAG: hypothetical protein U0361_03465 [Nitrospiraceae bacterium]